MLGRNRQHRNDLVPRDQHGHDHCQLRHTGDFWRRDGSGTVQINNSATLSDSSGNLEFDGSQDLAMSSSSTLDVAGDLIGSTTNITDFTPAGTVVLDGSGSASTRKPSKR